MKYAVIVTSLEARSGVNLQPVVTEAGRKFWVLNEPDGWVEATSIQVDHPFHKDGSLPSDLKVFDTHEDAEAFARRWKGHPWWCRPNGEFEIVTVEPNTRQVVDGYRRAS